MVNSVSIDNKINRLPVKTGYTAPNFRSNTTTLEKIPDADTVVITNQKTKQKKKKNPLAVAGGVIAGTALAAGAFVGALVIRQKSAAKRIAKLYEEKLILQNLPEHIEFKEAKTLDEAIQFAKDVLKIKEVDKDFSLEALNNVNRGIVDVSNYQKGKVYMPTALRFKSMEATTIASVKRNIYNSDFAEMTVNKKMYSHEHLDKELKQYLQDENGSLTLQIPHALKIECDTETRTLLNKYLDNRGAMSFNEKQTLLSTIRSLYEYTLSIDRNPMHFLTKNKAEFERITNTTVNLEELAKKSKEEQAEYLKKLYEKCKIRNAGIIKELKVTSPATSIYHEMGHLQDYGINLKNLDIKDSNINLDWKSRIKEAWKKAKCKFKGTEYKKPNNFEPVNNHFNRFDQEEMKKIYNADKEKFKALYPDLYEFSTDEKIQQTAGLVSGYAQTGIGEFIAESYKELVKGTKLPEEVMTLYRKYGGPLP